MKSELSSDYRGQELLIALNIGMLDVDFVEANWSKQWGDQVNLVHYSDGEYDIMIQ